MEKYLKIQDTCGIHNLHAMPGVIGGIVGAITAAAASESVYGKEGWVGLCLQVGHPQPELMLIFKHIKDNQPVKNH